jgi:hypothetical protein
LVRSRILWQSRQSPRRRRDAGESAGPSCGRLLAQHFIVFGFGFGLGQLHHVRQIFIVVVGVDVLLDSLERVVLDLGLQRLQQQFAIFVLWQVDLDDLLLQTGQVFLRKLMLGECLFGLSQPLRLIQRHLPQDVFGEDRLAVDGGGDLPLFERDARPFENKGRRQVCACLIGFSERFIGRRRFLTLDSRDDFAAGTG